MIEPTYKLGGHFIITEAVDMNRGVYEVHCPHPTDTVEDVNPTRDKLIRLDRGRDATHIVILRYSGLDEDLFLFDFTTKEIHRILHSRNMRLQAFSLTVDGGLTIYDRPDMCSYQVSVRRIKPEFQIELREAIMNELMANL